jgi:glutamate synthase (NADPH/NADH) small chain
VIGMGNTAIDAATQARRLGATEVTLVYRRTQAEMSCTEAELDVAKLDGCQLLWLAAPKEIIGHDGKVKALVCHRMELGTPDGSGRRYPIDTGETVTLDVEMVIKAAGQLPYTKLVDGAELTHDRGRIVVTGTATNLPGVFAGGDCVNGGKEVVDAVQAGKEAAAAILEYIAAGGGALVNP